MLRFPYFAWATAFAVALLPACAGAVELGAMAAHTGIGQVLEAEIELRGLGDLSGEEVHVGLASAEAFAGLGVERNDRSNDLAFSVEVGRNGHGVVHVKSSRPMREPYLDIVVQVLWPQGRLLREYSLLLDPPDATAAAARAADGQAFAECRCAAEPQPKARQRPPHAPRKAAAPSPRPLAEREASARLDEVQASLENARRQGDEVKGRIAEMQAQVARLSEQAALKDAQLSDLQARLVERNRQAAGGTATAAQSSTATAGASAPAEHP